ncbi:hypothetical protein XENTR_v10001547 [Xenopus tropicalis]|uniref:NACHT and WD repeat domain containing 1 n=2 Tax=Xenopus tropicalis TaxID=8364 RepID=A0A6I8QJH2_XENTR|nr:NACHT domain- and WD repeat-containing protein 1 isoform X1 [Xenopus tropicalis]KAE8632431.1 hypothetical protein XENTR_v10001547 [Xenopus tropicalis]|eukprot:XP_002934424.2 PREDICTED: NACHT domain- and WD repeat-containing protein 1 isoform X2 [Xenopus tropicalis]
MDSQGFKDILRGKETSLPTEPSNTVRLFISSTFSDMAEERNALMEFAYPDIQAFCQKHGLGFEVVDMRWGVRDYATVDHRTKELCLKEIDFCQKTSMGPSFIALVGNRYGFRPIPRVISEEEFNILFSKIQSNESDAQLLTKWFWKDMNTIPPTYVLQPITTHLPHYAATNPSFAELQAQEYKEWRNTEKQLTKALRLAALEAQIEGLITLEQKHKYFKSVTESEIECGLLACGANKEGSTIFLREVKDLNQCQISGLLDVREDGSTDTEAQDLLQNLKNRILTDHKDCVKTHVVEMSIQKNKMAYLHKLCDQAIAVVNHQILKCLPSGNAGQSQSENQHPWLGWLRQEVIHHLSSSQKKSQVFSGRQDLLQKIMSYIQERHSQVYPPLIIHGVSGSGKTALMCKAFEMLKQTNNGSSLMVLRLLGTSPQSSEIHDVLKSICYQLCIALELQPPSSQITNIYNETVRFFHQLLTTVSERKVENLVLFFDSLDQLSPSEGAHRLHWLPKECPANVCIVVSTLPEEGGILKTLKDSVTDPECYIEVKPLSAEQGSQMIEMLMASAGRRLTNDQQEIVLGSFRKCGQPLLLKLAFDEAKRWSSYTPITELMIATSTKEAVSLLYQCLEQLHGKLLVSHALGYIVASRSGLSEAELKDILSLDDEVLADIYQYWAPPSNDLIRFPTLPWTRLRNDLEGYLVERQADGSTVLGLYHRQFIEVARDTYLTNTEKSNRHGTLADYFMGKWSMGTKRPILLPLINKSLNADRKVASQPLWFSDNMPNRRKMSELPYHLLNAGCIDELQGEILGNMDWISSKIVSCGIQSVIKDFEMSVKLISSREIMLLRDTLRLFQPTINFIEGVIDPVIVFTEMLARMHFFQLSYRLIDELCQQCTGWLHQYPHPTFIPTCGFFQPPGGPLQTTVTGFKKGVTVMELCPDHDLLVVGSEDGIMIVWNIKDIEVIHTLTGHNDGIRCIKMFEKGTRAVSGSLDHTLLLWNLVTGKQYLCIHEDHTTYENAYLHVDEKNSIIYSAAGSQVYAWKIESGAPLLNLSPGVPNFPLQAAVFCAHQLLITVTEGGTVHLWDSATGELKGSRQLPGVGGEDANPVCSCFIPRHGKMVVGFENGFLAVISSGGGVSTEKMSSAVVFVVPSEDESLFAAGFGKQVQIFRADSNALRTFLDSPLEHEDFVKSVVINNGRNIILTGSQDETIRIWSLSHRGTLLDTFYGMGVSVTSLALHGGTLISSSKNAYYLKLWTLDYDQQHKTLTPFQERSGCVALSDAGNRVYFPKTGDKHKIVVWDSKQGRMADIVEASAEVKCLEVAENSRILFVGLTSGTVLAFPLDQKQDVACIPPPGNNMEVVCLSLSKQENRLAVAYHNLILLYDVTKGDPLPVLDGPIHSVHPGSTSSICKTAVLEDQRLLYGMASGEIYLFNCEMDNTCQLEPHERCITCLETSNSETLALSGCEDSVQRLWNIDSGQWVHEMCYKGFFFQGVDCACFSKDDRFIFTGSQDRAIKAWDVSSGSLLAVQYVYASVTRLLPTAEGFIGTTKLGYIIRETFQCPQNISPQYNALKNIKATCTVKSRNTVHNEKAGKVTAKMGKPWWRCKEQNNKTSQICQIV